MFRKQEKQHSLPRVLVDEARHQALPQSDRSGA